MTLALAMLKLSQQKLTSLTGKILFGKSLLIFMKKSNQHQIRQRREPK